MDRIFLFSRQTLLKSLAIHIPINKIYFNIYVKSSFEIQEFYYMHFLLLRLSSVYLNRNLDLFFWHWVGFFMWCGGGVSQCICFVTESVISLTKFDMCN